jgi:hypothetical protein
MENLGVFYDHFVYFTAIRNILWAFGIHILWYFGIFSSVLVFLTKKNLATLLRSNPACFKRITEREKKSLQNSLKKIRLSSESYR